MGEVVDHPSCESEVEIYPLDLGVFAMIVRSGQEFFYCPDSPIHLSLPA